MKWKLTLGYGDLLNCIFVEVVLAFDAILFIYSLLLLSSLVYNDDLFMYCVVCCFLWLPHGYRAQDKFQFDLDTQQYWRLGVQLGKVIIYFQHLTYRNKTCLSLINDWTNKKINTRHFYSRAALCALKPTDAFYHQALLFITKDKFHTHHLIYIKKLADFQQWQRRWIALYLSLQLHWQLLCTALLHYILKPLIIASKCWTVFIPL